MLLGAFTDEVPVVLALTSIGTVISFFLAMKVHFPISTFWIAISDYMYEICMYLLLDLILMKNNRWIEAKLNELLNGTQFERCIWMCG